MLSGLNIRKKIAFTVLISITPVLLLSVFLALYIVQKQAISDELYQVSSRLQEGASVLKSFYATARSDLFLSSRLSATADFLTARQRKDREQEVRRRDELERMFAGLMEGRVIYDQIRLLDRQGMECIRVNRTPAGSMTVAPEEMQDKSGRYYYTKSINLKPDELYVSRIDLNQENGMVERPLKPVLRVAAPVIDADGRSVGVLVINVLAEQALRLDPEDGSNAAHALNLSFVIDEKGAYLYHNHHPEKMWGGPEDLNTGEGLDRDYPGILDEVMEEKEVPIRFLNHHCRLYSQVVELFPGYPQKLIIGYAVPDEKFLAEVYRAGHIFTIASGLAFLVAVSGSWFSLRRIFHPLEELAQLVDHVRRGDFSLRMTNIRGQDEIAGLSHGFNEMADEIERHQHTLESQVGERTRQLEESRRAALSLMQDARHEVAERKRIEEQLRNLSLATEQSPASIVVTDCAGTIEYVNPKFCEVTGYSEKEAIGKNPRILKSGEQSPEYYKTMWKTILAGHDWRGQFQNRTKSGELYWAQASISPIRNEQGKVTSFVAVEEDITKQMKAAEELAAAKEEAVAASLAKSEFLANMSHEIRTPMNALMGMTHLALQTDLTSRQEKYLSQIDRSSRNLLQIINDILDFSKIEAGKLEIETIPFNLREVLDHTAVMLSGSAMKKGLEFLIDLKPEVPADLIGDPLRLGQVLINLTNNAIKFTEKGEVIVSIEAVESGRGRVKLLFSIKDSGIGLTEDQRTRLFKAFEQADTSTTRKYGGTGLGLAISRQLVEMMGGSLDVESEPGQGCTFTFTLDFSLSAEAETKPFVPDSDLRNLKVLLVDDNKSVRNVVGKMLELMTFRVTPAGNSSEALSLLQAAGPDDPFRLVLLDWKLGGTDGLQVAEQIHAESLLGPEGKIIIFSGNNEAEEQIKGIPWLDSFLMKPLTCSSLFDAVMSVFGKSAAQSDAGHKGRLSPESIGKSPEAAILLVEDNEINQIVAQELLHLAGLRATVAVNGEEAVALVESNHFDLILMDVQMPVMDGYAATRKIRERENQLPGRPKVPIIAMTAHARKIDHEKSREAGMNGHLTKPIDPALFYNMLKEWLPDNPRAVSEASSASFEAEAALNALQVEGLDTAEGMQRVGGRSDLYLEILRKFIANYAASADQVRKEIKTGRTDEAIRRIHSLKGLCGSVGASALQKAAAELEARLGRGEADEKCCRAFEVEFDAFCRSLRTALSGLDDPEPAAGAAAGTDTELQALLVQMKVPLDEGRPVELQQIADQMRSKQWDSRWNEALEQLQLHLSRYQFDAARSLRQQLLDDISEGEKKDT